MGDLTTKKSKELDVLAVPQPDISIEQATAESVSKEVFDREFTNLKKDLIEQKKLNWQIIMVVVVAFLFTIGLIAVEIMLFHTCANKDFLDMQNQYFQKIEEIKEENFQTELRLQNEINDLKIKLIQDIE